LPDHSTDTFPQEICSSADETDDASQIPERHADRAERIELRQETLKKVEKIGQPQERRRKGKRQKLMPFRMKQSHSRISLQMNEQPTRNYNPLKLIWKINIFFLTE
jgi:hypothetical protein